MEKLFTITLLTLISVFEIVMMLMGSMIPTAAVLIAFILLLVFLMVFRLGSRHFWKMIRLIYILNLLLACYLLLKLGFNWQIILIFFMLVGGMVFALASSCMYPRKKVIGFTGVSTRPSIMPTKLSESHAASLIENYIREYEERRKAEEIPEPPRPEQKAGQEAKKPTTTVKKKYSPGKFLASMQGKQYHKPRCLWAKKIRKENQLWFADAKEAESKGYTKHSCIK